MEKNRLIFDTSALISLETIHLLERVFDSFEIITTDSVIKELENFAKYEDDYGFISKRVLLYSDRFKISKAALKEVFENLENTDNELYNLAKLEKVVVITDDIKFSNITREKIKTKFSTFFLGFFISKGGLTKLQALERLEKLRDIRNWQHNIIYLVTKEELES